MIAGLVGCGDGDGATTGSSSGSATTGGEQPSQPSEGSPEGRNQGDGADAGEESDGQPGGGGSTSGDQGSANGRSGGTAEEFVHPGKDNSIPKFGEEGGSPEEAEIEALLTRYLDARAAGDWKTVCSYLGGDATAKLDLVTRATKGRISGCLEVIEAIAGKSPPASRENPLVSGIASLRIDGLEAFALFHGPEGVDYVMPLFKEDGDWKVTELAPIPYPLGSAPPTQ